MRSIQSKNCQDHRTLLNTCGVLGQITFINSPGAKTMNSPLYLYICSFACIKNCYFNRTQEYVNLIVNMIVYLKIRPSSF